MATYPDPTSFVRIHKTLRVTPAMAAGITDRLWEIGDIVAVLETPNFCGRLCRAYTHAHADPSH